MAEAAKSLKVFVSYSRADVDFADQLVLALEDKGFETILDRHDLSGGENWRERLGKLILSADAVAFVLTAKSATSEICSWEVDEAKRLGKRILPVTPASPAGATPPAALGELNWIPFYADPAIPGSGFYYGVKRLMEALSVDLDWLRDQTRYSERASEWARARPDDLLLRGEALKDAEAWLARAPAGSRPPDLVREYLSSSSDAEQQRQTAAKAQLEEREQALKQAEAAIADKVRTDRTLRRLAVSALAAGLVLVAAAGAGLWYAARNYVEASERNAALFAGEANELTARGDHIKAMLVALAGDPAARKGPIEQFLQPDGYPAAREALARAYAANRMITATATGSPVTTMAAYPDGKRFITFHEDLSVRIWEAGNAAPVKEGRTLSEVKKAIAFPDGERLLVLTSTYDAGIWRPGDVVIAPLGGNVDPVTKVRDDQAYGIALNEDGDLALTVGGDHRSVAWDLSGAAPVVAEVFAAPDQLPLEISLGEPIGIVFTEDEEQFATADEAGNVLFWDFAEAAPIQTNTIGEYIEASTLSYAEGAVLVGAENGRIYGFEPEEEGVTGDLQAFSQLKEDPVADVQMLVEDPMLLVRSASGQLILLRGMGRSLETFGPGSRVAGAVFLPGAGAVATASTQGVISTWRLRTDVQLIELPKRYGTARFVDSAKAIHLYGDGDEDGVWRIGQTEFEKTWSRKSPKGLKTPSHDGKLVAVAASGKVEIWRAGESAPFKTVSVQSVSNPTFSLDGKRLFFPRPGMGDTGVLEVEGAREVQSIPVDTNLSSFAIHPDGERILAIHGGNAAIWRIGASQPDSSVNVGADIFSVSFVPDGTGFIVGRQDGRIELWRVGESRPAQVFEGKGRAVEHVAFDPSGMMMLTVNIDAETTLWRMGRTEQLQSFASAADGVSQIAFDPDGRHILALSGSNLERWQIDPVTLATPDEQVRMVCTRLEELGVTAFTPEDRLALPILDANVPDDPCLAMGVSKRRPPAPAKAEPALTAGAPN